MSAATGGWHILYNTYSKFTTNALTIIQKTVHFIWVHPIHWNCIQRTDVLTSRPLSTSRLNCIPRSVSHALVIYHSSKQTRASRLAITNFHMHHTHTRSVRERVRVCATASTYVLCGTTRDTSRIQYIGFVYVREHFAHSSSLAHVLRSLGRVRLAAVCLTPSADDMRAIRQHQFDTLAADKRQRTVRERAWGGHVKPGSMRCSKSVERMRAHRSRRVHSINCERVCNVHL